MKICTISIKFITILWHFLYIDVGRQLCGRYDQENNDDWNLQITLGCP